VKTYRVSPKPPKPSDGSSDTVKLPRPIKKHSPKPEPTPKPKPKKDGGMKRRDVSDEQIKPRRTKPTPNRRRFLDELNEMNKRGGK
jgi:hypothetical protein